MSTSTQNTYVLTESVYHFQPWWLSIPPAFVRKTLVKKKIRKQLYSKQFSMLVNRVYFHCFSQNKQKSHHSEKQPSMSDPSISF